MQILSYVRVISFISTKTHFLSPTNKPLVVHVANNLHLLIALWALVFYLVWAEHSRSLHACMQKIVKYLSIVSIKNSFFLCQYDQNQLVLFL